MISSLAMSRTGLDAASLRLEASAANVANQRTSGALPAEPGGRAGAYAPVDVVQVSRDGAGVEARLAERRPAYYPAYDPGSPDANAQGLVAMPNVDLVEEVTNQILAAASFEANVAAMRAAKDMAETLLDVTA
ncbi:flagellar basal body rod protein FlgC [Salinarimonas ramus]|uniref:Flagellar basal-body rod protein FlgC n=1 Tax=Salinarimonas ramus TaxID=690164 RepID=A0A917V5C4_9HYPH|nr:flagellar basal body rod C-terminal domain-containing protein [Salinarimonas ramus]GGK42094.1 flagellar basal-body rod protein FlgC [Salinarimonas ramus]